jgi:transcription termination factor NusB
MTDIGVETVPASPVAVASTPTDLPAAAADLASISNPSGAGGKPEGAGVESAPSAPAPDAPKEGEKAPLKPEDARLAAKFAALAREEKKLREWARAEREKLSQERQSLESKYGSIAKLMEKAAYDPDELLKAAGWDFDKLTRYYATGKALPPEVAELRTKETVQREIAEFKKQQEEAARKAQEEAAARAREQYEQQVESFRSDIQRAIEAAGEKAELTSIHPEAIDLVFNVMQHHFETTKRVLAIDEAIEAVEKYLEDESAKWIERSKKLKSKVLPTQAQAPQAPAATPAPSAPKTLTNEIQSQVSTPKRGPVDAFDIEKSKEEAAKLLRWV